MFLVLNFLGIRIHEAASIVIGTTLLAIFFKPSLVRAIVKVATKKDLPRWTTPVLWLPSALVLAYIIHEWTVPFVWLMSGAIVIGTIAFFMARKFPSIARWLVLRGVPGVLALIYVPLFVSMVPGPMVVTVIDTETRLERYRVQTDVGTFENVPNAFLRYFKDAETQGELKAGAGEQFRVWKTGFRIAPLQMFPRIFWAEAMGKNPPLVPPGLVDIIIGVVGIPSVIGAIVAWRARKRIVQVVEEVVSEVSRKGAAEEASSPEEEGRISLIPERLQKK
jgi:hypothetical protein